MARVERSPAKTEAGQGRGCGAAGNEFYAMSEVDELPAAGCGHPAWVSRQGTRQSGQGAAAWGNRAAVSRCPSAADGGPVGGCFGVTTAMLLLSWLCKPLGGGEHRPCLSSSTPPAQGGA